MAVQESYALTDFTSYALKNFEAVFELMSDLSVYNFELRQFRTKEGDLIEAELLQFAYWMERSFGFPAWAHFDGDDMHYYRGKAGEVLESCHPPIASGGNISLIQDYKEPFCHAVPYREPECGMKNRKVIRENARTLARNRLTLLIKFVFLLKGHIARITNKEDIDLLIEFKKLCMHVQQNKMAVEAKSQVIIPGAVRRASNSITANSNDASASEHNDMPANFESIGSDASSMAIRNAKRDISMAERDSLRRYSILLTFSILIQASDTRKRARIPTDTSSLDEPVLQPDQPPSRLQSILNTLIEECKTEAEGQWAQEKEASQLEIRALKDQFAIEQEKARVADGMAKTWQEKYEKLKDKVAKLMGDD